MKDTGLNLILIKIKSLNSQHFLLGRRYFVHTKCKGLGVCVKDKSLKEISYHFKSKLS